MHTTLLFFFQLELSPPQIVFHTHPSYSVIRFSLNHLRNTFKDGIATYCDSLLPHLQNSDQDLNPFFRSFISKPFSSGFSPAEHAMLIKYYSIHCHITNELNSHTSTIKTTHLKQLRSNYHICYPLIFSTC